MGFTRRFEVGDLPRDAAGVSGFLGAPQRLLSGLARVGPVEFSRGAAAGRRRARREVVYLVAPSGHPNYGDEFILRAWLRHLARVRPDADLVVDCHTPGQAAVLLRDCHPNITFVDTAWRICFETAHLDPAEAVTVAAEVVHDPGRMPKLASGIEMLARADIVHLVGGGYVNAVWPHHLGLLATANAAVERSKGRAVATGQGLTPVGGAERLALLRELQARFALFDVRDAPSHHTIAGSDRPAMFTGDDAWLGLGDTAVFDSESPAAERSFVFCLQSDLMDDFATGRGADGIVDAVSRLIDTWNVDGSDTAVVEAIPGSDRVVFDRIAQRLPGVVFVPFTELWNRGLPARPGQTWVSTRFHVHLLAAAAGASGLALLGRSDYYPTKHTSLITAGSRWHLTDSTDFPPRPVRDGGFHVRTVELLQRRKHGLADRIYPPPRRVRRAVDSLRTSQRA